MPKIKKILKHNLLAGVNPKINNMTPAYKAAKYSLLLVSDSGIKSKASQQIKTNYFDKNYSVKEDTLTDMVLAMKENVGLVHQMPYTCDGAGLPSTLEKVRDIDFGDRSIE